MGAYVIERVISYGLLDEYGATLLSFDKDGTGIMAHGFDPPDGIFEELEKQNEFIKSAPEVWQIDIDDDKSIAYFSKLFEYKNVRYNIVMDAIVRGGWWLTYIEPTRGEVDE